MPGRRLTPDRAFRMRYLQDVDSYSPPQLRRELKESDP